MKKMAFWLVAAAVAAGCGKQESPAAPAAAACTTAGTACKVPVRPEEAATFANKYKYQTVGTCADKSLRFSWLTLSDRIVVATTTDGNEVVADLAVMLMDDGSLSGFYQEKTQKRGEEGFWQTIEIKNKKDLTGRWAPQGLQVAIDGFGLGDPVLTRGWSGLQFTLPEDTTVWNAALAKKQISLIVAHSTISKDGKTVDQTCAEAQP